VVYDDYSFTYLTILSHIFTTAPPRSYVPFTCVYTCLYVSICVCVPTVPSMLSHILTTVPSMSLCGCRWASVGESSMSLCGCLWVYVCVCGLSVC